MSRANTTPTDVAGPLRVCMHVLSTGRTDGRVMREATALAGAGYDVTIVDIERDGARPAREDIDGVHFRHVIMPSRFVRPRFRPWFVAKVALAMLRGGLAVLRTPTDVVHAHDENTLPACYLAAVARGKALVFDAHELPMVQRNITSWRPLRAAAQWALRRLVMPRCAATIIVSPPLADEMQRRYGGKRAVVVRNILPYIAPIASDRLRERLGLGPAARIALYQGGLQANRSLDILVRAAKYLGSDEYIVLMGWGPSERALAALIQQEGVGDRVKMLPAVPYEELLDWTASADVGLNVFDPDYSLSIHYCLPNKLFEYLMAGVPVFTSELPAVVEIVRQYDVGVVTPSIAPEEVARHLSALLADAAARARMRQNALAASQSELRWEVEREQVIGLYRATFGGSRPVRDAAPVTATTG